jgi:TonB-linked SusC/RagA family outer membrane protein
MNLNFYKKKPRTRNLFSLLTAMLLVATQAFADPSIAEVTVTGKVTAADDGSPLPGVNVYVKGTQVGTITDSEGVYSLTTDEDNGILVFSYIGYATQEVSIGGRTSINVVLQPSLESLDEVVVTALGIKREEKSLGYSVGKVNGDDLTRVAQENVLNGLSGRIPGVTISSVGSTGSSVSMVIRGASSLTSDNQPLFVVDGVPVANTLNNVTEIGRDNKVDYGNAISNLNPEDIETISVLKGPSAAALYGSRAGNGVVLITTKGAKSNKLTVSLTSNTVFDVPYKYLDMHSKFATGILPFTPDNNPYPGGILQIDEASAGGVGPELDKGYNAIQWNSPLDENGDPIPTPLVSHRDNMKNFVQTGITTTNGISIAKAGEQVSYRLSYNNMTNRGIVPNSDLHRNSLNLNTSFKASEKITVSTNLDFSRNNSDNRPSGNRGTNPLQWAYAVSPHIDIRDLRNYWVPGEEGLQQLSQAPGDYNNPWFLAYEVNNSFVRDRVFGNIKADYQITPEFSIMARYALDTYNEQRETKIGNSYTGEPRGAYGIVDLNTYERNADFLATYKKDISDFSFTASAGGNLRFNKSTYVGSQSRSGTGLIVPGLYTIQNIAPQNLLYASSSAEKAVHSIYGLINVGFKDMIYLDVTARNDWSSTLPKDNRSYFYPSASLSVLINEMVEISPNLDLLKLRAGVARAGNDTEPYSLFSVMGNLEAWDGQTRLNRPSNLKIPTLKPEIATATDLGIDVTLFRNRLRFSGTYYLKDNENQIFNNERPSSSGVKSILVNAGLVRSTGIELALGGTPFDRNGLRWDVNLNYSTNKTTIEELADGMDRFIFWTDAKGGAWTFEGEEVGDIYDNKLVTVEDPTSPYYGYPILDENGSWQSINAVNTKNKIGNFNPDFIMGLQTSVSYKAFTLNLAFEWRNGGDFVSQTYRYGESDLKTQRFLDNLINPGNRTGDELRNYLVDNNLVVVDDKFNIVGGPTAEYGGFPFEYGGNTYPYGVFNPGVIAEYDDEGNIVGYVENLGGPGTKIIPYGDNYPWDYTKAATFDASFIKLREVSLSYALPSSFVKRIGLQNASLSLYSRNIMLWTKAKIGVDPETAFQHESSKQGGIVQFKQGIERYNVTPWVIPIGFKLGLTF